MKKRVISCTIIIAMILVLLWPFSTVSHAEENWRDITQYVNVSSTAWGQTSRWENYHLNIYYESSNRWGMTIGRVVVDDYSRDGYFVIFLGGWNTSTSCVTYITAIRDMGSEIFIELARGSTGPGGQAMTPWNLFIEIPVAFSDSVILIGGDVGRPSSDWEGLRVPHIRGNDEIVVYLNGERLEFDVSPQIINGRTMVPMRVIFDALGAGIWWDGERQSIVAEKTSLHQTTATLQIGNYEMFVTTRYLWIGVPHDVPRPPIYSSGRVVDLDVAPVIIDNRTLVPLRAVSEVFDADVEWDGDTQTVIIRTVNYTDFRTPVSATVSFESALFAAMPTGENYMISPFSLRMALAMAANGASGETQTEILAALGIDDLDAFNQAAAAFIASSNENEAVEFNIANSIWFNEDLFGVDELDFSPTYRRIIADYFAGVAQRVNAEDGADIINTWISEQTRNRINDVIDEDAFCDEDSETLAILVNAIYFNGDWASPFNPERTRDGVFTDRNGVESAIPFMVQTGWFDIYENDYFRMLAKSYEDDNIRMYFVLPNVDKRLPFSMFEESIDQMRHSEVRLRLPRFTTEFLHDNLVEILQGMGIQRAFERERHFDFVGYANMIYPYHVFGETLLVWIGDVLQKTFIEVDEEGTEAAAVTVVYMDAMPTSIPPPPIPFYCDRPFIYFIRNDATGDILFMGEFAFVE